VSCTQASSPTQTARARPGGRRLIWRHYKRPVDCIGAGRCDQTFACRCNRSNACRCEPSDVCRCNTSDVCRCNGTDACRCECRRDSRVGALRLVG
jgi:hypothetical protein